MVYTTDKLQRKPVTEKELGERREEKLQGRLKDLKEHEQERETQYKATLVKFPYINLKSFPIDKEALSLVFEEEARTAQIVCFYKDEGSIRVGIVDPGNKELTHVLERLKKEGDDIKIYLISPPSLDYAMQFYRQVIRPKKPEDTLKVVTEAAEMAGKIKSLSELSQMIHRTALSHVVALVLANAASVSASDIHVEPGHKSVFVRYRLDGVLQAVAEITPEDYEKFIDRVKFLSHMKLNISDVPQDGRFTINVGKKEIDLRVSTLPTPFGESLVMRLLGVGMDELKLDNLGLRPEAQKILREEMLRPNGMILTTGPTGSGKTTTLYTLLQEKKSPGIKIITLEDPVEYRLEGVIQTQISADVGMTFEKGLRAILRQNPDVVMVGEIRDLETADIACQAAMTGHLVFSTLHTNDAAGVIPRLVTMGVRPYVIGPALRVAMAQRLLRRLCKVCREEYKPDAKLLEIYKKDLGVFFPKGGIKKLFRAKEKGCEKCHHTGYSGRVGIYEVFRVTPEMEKMITGRISALEIQQVAIKQGMITMRQDGFLKSIDAITSFEEVERIT